MQTLHCPTCGRYCGETDAPPGYVVSIPRCTRCRLPKVLARGAEAPSPPAGPAPPRRPPPRRPR